MLWESGGPSARMESGFQANARPFEHIPDFDPVIDEDGVTIGSALPGSQVPAYVTTDPSRKQAIKRLYAAAGLPVPASVTDAWNKAALQKAAPYLAGGALALGLGLYLFSKRKRARG